MVTTPGFVIAATSSGSGKTTIATGMMAALSRKMRVAPFKVGPDYIDPGYHGMAAGHQGRNLDSVMCGIDLIGPLYAHGSANADIAVVEGVMGLFDGRIAQGQNTADAQAQGSSAEIAATLGLPVVLVVDVRGMSQSVGAVVRGFATADPHVRIAGVILNKVGTDRHAEVCREAVEAVGVRVLGAIPRVDHAEVPSRHLGLITSVELDAAEDAVAAMATMVEEHVDLNALIELADCAYNGPAWDPALAMGMSDAEALDNKPVIALAGGPAFSFTYAEHVEMLSAAGATVVAFDPLSEQLPQCDGLIIPGGFPEEHCDVLEQRADLKQQVCDVIAQGIPVHAECAGLLWLLSTLDGRPMLDVIPTHGAMGRRLTLGYRDAVVVHDSVIYRAGERVTGHEFHHTAIADSVVPGWDSAWGWRAWDGSPKVEGFVSGNVHASYLHIHPAAVPAAVRRFVEACAR